MPPNPSDLTTSLPAPGFLLNRSEDSCVTFRLERHYDCDRAINDIAIVARAWTTLRCSILRDDYSYIPKHEL